MESKTQLNDTTIAKVNDLIQANANSAEIYGNALSLEPGDALTVLFRDLKLQREAQASELRASLNQSGVFETAESSLAAPLQSWLMKARDFVQSEDHVGLLSELERSEDRILHAYEDALKETAGSPLNADLHRQVTAVKETHDRIRDLRDSAKARS